MILELAVTAAALGLAAAALAGAAWLFLNLARRHEAPVEPLCIAALLAGLAAAAALLLAAPDRADFEPARLFAAGSAWSAGGLATAANRALPSAPTLAAAAAALGGTGPALLVAAAWAAVLAAASGLGLILHRLAGPARLRMALAFVAMAACTALVTRYATQLLAWGAAQLGFWLLLVALVLFQRWRHRPGTAGH